MEREREEEVSNFIDKFDLAIRKGDLKAVRSLFSSFSNISDILSVPQNPQVLFCLIFFHFFLFFFLVKTYFEREIYHSTLSSSKTQRNHLSIN